MKRTTQLLTLTTAILATIVLTMIVSPADASKRVSVSSDDIGFVDVFNLIDKALLADAAAAEREDFNTKSNEVISPLNLNYSTLKIQLGNMQQTDPNAQAVVQQYQYAETQLNNTSNQINAAYEVLIARQLSDAYTAIYAAANEIAQQEGLVFLFATRANGDLIQTQNITGVTQEILARPLMTPPAGVDITELVRIKLGYPEKAPEPVIAPVAEPVATPVSAPAVDPAAAVTEFTDTPAKTEVND